VLIVDDVPDNLSVLHDALDESGYTVLVATSGEAALQRAAAGIARHRAARRHDAGHGRLRGRQAPEGRPQTAHIPIIFMTGLTETEHLVAALEAGGVDYVTKPIKPKEVLARMGVHLQARAPGAAATRNALDAFGYASITVRARRRPPDVADAAGARAADGLLRHQRRRRRPSPVLDWLRATWRKPSADRAAAPDGGAGAKRLTFRLHQQTGPATRRAATG
jgi:DNA-binding response OmpR family regulator